MVKQLHAQLKAIVKGAGYNPVKLNTFEMPSRYNIAPELKSLIIGAVASSYAIKIV